MIILDQQQLACQKQLAISAAELSLQGKDNIFSQLSKKLFFRANKIQGIYLHGSVGRGKTMLMQEFYQQVTLPKKIMHYQHFMQIMHEQLHQLRKMQQKITNEKFLIEKLANNLAANYRLLCIDEFELKDITDAMLVVNLFKLLGRKSVFIFLTTNLPPEQLYLDGLQRDSILPFIEGLKNNFTILHLDAERDYRFNILEKLAQRLIFPFSLQNQQIFQRLLADICPEDQLVNGSVELLERNINFAKTHNNILITDFTELFSRNLSYADYLAVTKKFSIILVDQVRKIEENEHNIIIRFINFVDQAYFNKILLFMQMQVSPSELYIGKYSKEFQRTISRLNEMNRQNYPGKR